MSAADELQRQPLRAGRFPWHLRQLIGPATLFAVAVAPLDAQPAPEERTPIIDMHLHLGGIRSEEHLDSVRTRLAGTGVRLVAVSADDTAATQWSDAAPDQFWVGPSFPCYGGRFGTGDPCFAEWNGWADLAWLRRQYEEGRLRTMGELFYVYYGIPPTDERLEPYWALAEDLGIPVGVHTGRRGRSDLPVGCCPNYDDDLGAPSLLLPVLERHPELKVWLMHAPGAVEWTDETVALMQSHPRVYADMSVVNSIVPEPAHAGAVQAFLEAGLIDRIMFGSDNHPVQPIVDRINRIEFLTQDQKRGILCENAARFFELGRDFCH